MKDVPNVKELQVAILLRAIFGDMGACDTCNMVNMCPGVAACRAKKEKQTKGA